MEVEGEVSEEGVHDVRGVHANPRSESLSEPGGTEQVGVGRAVACRKLRVTEVLALDCADLRRSGAFERPLTAAGGPVWTVPVGHGPFAGPGLAYVVLAEGGRPVGLAVWTPRPGDRRVPGPGWQAISLTRTWPHFARHRPRYWFRAPCCGTRRRVLYAAPRRRGLVCRDCGQLSYASRQMHRLALYEGALKPLEALFAADRALRTRRQSKRGRRAFQRLARVEAAAGRYRQILARRRL